MSNDLTPDKLEEMILEELQRLDEFSIPIKITRSKNGRASLASTLGISDQEDLKNIAKQSKWGATDQAWKDFANINSKDPNLDPDDFKKAFGAKNKPDAQFGQRTYQASNKGDTWWKKIGGRYNPTKLNLSTDGSTSTSTSTSSSSTGKKNTFAKAASGLDDPKKVNPNQKDVNDPLGGPLDLNYTALNLDDKAWVKKGEFITQGGVQMDTVDTMKAELAEHNNSLNDLFTHYGNLSAIIKGAAEGKQKDVTTLDAMDAGKLFNSARVLATLAGIANDVQGSSAGTIFECALALIAGGAVVGGDGGAGDVLSKSGKLMLSAKNYAIPSDSKMLRTPQAKSNIDKLKKNEVIWYVLFSKYGEKGKLVQLGIHITGIKRITKGNDNVNAFECIGPDGNQLKVGRNTPGLLKDSKDYKIPFQYLKHSDVIKIDIGSKALAAATTNIDVATFKEIFNAATQNSSDDVKKHFNQINQKLAIIKSRTNSFIAGSGGSMSLTQIKAIAKQSGDAYKDLKAELKGGYGGLAQKGSKTAIKGYFEESKTQELDDLIAEVMQEIQIKRKK